MCLEKFHSSYLQLYRLGFEEFYCELFINNWLLYMSIHRNNTSSCILYMHIITSFFFQWVEEKGDRVQSCEGKYQHMSERNCQSTSTAYWSKQEILKTFLRDSTYGSHSFFFQSVTIQEIYANKYKNTFF